MALSLAGLALDRRKLLLIGLVVLVCAGLVLLYRQIDVAALHRHAEALNGPLVFVLVTVLPLVGFPVSVAHAVVGVRFGLLPGLALVAVSIVLQLLASYALVKLAPRFFARRFASFRARLPKAADPTLTLFTMLLPGAPYFAQNYVLPLVGVPLRTYLLWGGSIHLVKSVVGIAFGDMSDRLTPARLAGFAAYAVLTTAVCAWAFRRLQSQLQDPPPAADGPTPRA